MSSKEKLIAMIKKVQPGPTAPSPDSVQRQKEYRKRLLEAQRRYRE